MIVAIFSIKIIRADSKNPHRFCELGIQRIDSYNLILMFNLSQNKEYMTKKTEWNYISISFFLEYRLWPGASGVLTPDLLPTAKGFTTVP